MLAVNAVKICVNFCNEKEIEGARAALAPFLILQALTTAERLHNSLHQKLPDSFRRLGIFFFLGGGCQ